MTGIVEIMIQVYRFLLRLYPGSFRHEFQEQMLLDFSDMAVDARKRGRAFFALFCLRELIDFPVNLIRMHFQEGYMFKVIHSQPITYGLRSALGFGIGFAIVILSHLWLSRWLFIVLEPMLTAYSVWYYQTFHNERWIWLLDIMVRLLSYAITGIVFGFVFSLLAGAPRKRSKYFLAGLLTWLIPSLIAHVVSQSFGWSFFLNERQSTALGLSISVLTGVFFGACLGFAESERNIPTRYWVGAVIGYPFATYLVIRLFFFLWLEITPWFFVFLMLWMVILILSVVVAALSTNRKTLWMILGGVGGCLILDQVALYIGSQILHLPQFPLNAPRLQNGGLLYYEVGWAATEAIFGVLLGLVLGLIFGYQQKNKPVQLEQV